MSAPTDNPSSSPMIVHSRETAGEAMAAWTSSAPVASSAPPGVPALINQVRGAMTNFEREEIVIQFVRSGETALTCAELGEVMDLFTLSTRKVGALIAVHPLLSDKEELPQLLEQQLLFAGDREDVRRAVARNARRAWLENAFDDDD